MLSAAYAVFLIQQGRFGSLVACHTLAARSGVPLTLTEKSNVKWSTGASERRYRADVCKECWLFVWPSSLTLPSSGKASDGREENKGSAGVKGNNAEWKGKAALLVELSGRSVGRRDVRWQESGTATQLCFGVEGPPEIGVTVFHCQGEDGERNTRDAVMCRQRRRIWRRQKKNESKKVRQTLEQLLLYCLMVQNRGKKKRGLCWQSGGR